MMSRYAGFGKGIYHELKDELPFVFDNLTFYTCLSSQKEHSYAVCHKDTKPFAIQLDPLGDVIVLWNRNITVRNGNVVKR
jgi:hypothetical protein